MGSGSWSVKDSGAEKFGLYRIFVSLPYQAPMAEADLTVNIPKASSRVLDEGHRLRSAFLDATAQLESHLAKLMTKLGLDEKLSAPLGQRLAELVKSKKAPKIARIQSELLELASLRAKIAHSKLSIVLKEESLEPCLCFSLVPIDSHDATIIPVEAFKQAEVKVKQLANQLKQMTEATLQS